MFKKISLCFLVLTLTACQSVSTLPDGKKAACVGINDDKNPQYVYKFSVRNIIVGIIFVELVAPPVIVLFEELQCPVAYKNMENK